MAAPKTKNSHWFKHPTGVGWKCQGCGRCNSTKVKTCSRCKFLKGGHMKTVDCKFCDGVRPVDPATHRCKGCGMEEGSCKRSPEPLGKRPCPVCDCRVVRWINDNTQLECVVCHTEFEAVTPGDKVWFGSSTT